MSIYRKLQDARIKLQNTELKKTGYNSFSKYYYFEIGDFLPTVQNIFSELGLCGIVSFSADLATLRIVNMEDEKEIIITSPLSSAELKGCHAIQNVGACELYSRRYLWVAAMEIVEHDAIDGLQQDAPIKQSAKLADKPKEGLTEDEMADVGMAMRESGDTDALKAVFGSAYKKANKAQRDKLKKYYDTLTLKLEVPA